VPCSRNAPVMRPLLPRSLLARLGDKALLHAQQWWGPQRNERIFSFICWCRSNCSRRCISACIFSIEAVATSHCRNGYVPVSPAPSSLFGAVSLRVIASTASGLGKVTSCW
jgi:hypothetical protein